MCFYLLEVRDAVTIHASKHDMHAVQGRNVRGPAIAMSHDIKHNGVSGCTPDVAIGASLF